MGGFGDYRVCRVYRFFFRVFGFIGFMGLLGFFWGFWVYKVWGFRAWLRTVRVHEVMKDMDSDPGLFGCKGQASKFRSH